MSLPPPSSLILISAAGNKGCSRDDAFSSQLPSCPRRLPKEESGSMDAGVGK
jgi:hypothetical protein